MVTLPNAVRFDADGMADSVNGGIVINNGTITATAGSSTGGLAANGGDILFDGRGTGGDPISGSVTQSATGTGVAGSFLGD